MTSNIQPGICISGVKYIGEEKSTDRMKDASAERMRQALHAEFLTAS